MCDLGDKLGALNIFNQLIAKTAKGKYDELFILHESRADCYIINNEYARAIEDLTRAITLYEKILSSQHAKSADVWERAKREYEIEKESGQKRLLYSKRADMYRFNKQLNNALSDYEKSCELCKRAVDCYEHDCVNAFDVKREIKRGANWEIISRSKAEGGNQEVFYDKTRIIVRSERNIRYWLRFETTVGLNKNEFPKEDFSMKMFLYHLDCVNQEAGFASYVTYDNDGQLTDSWSGNPDTTRQPIIPGSIGDAVSEVICDLAKKKSGQKKNKSQIKTGPEKHL